MKKLQTLFVFLFFITLTAGCAHGQIASTPPETVMITWTQPTTCAAVNPSCTITISSATVSSTATSCPATNGTAYSKVVGTVSGTPPVTTLTDSAPPAGSAVCYCGQNTQYSQTTACSSASNNNVPLVIQPAPTAPGSPNASTVAQNDNPLKPPTATLAMNEGMRITARVNNK